MPGRLSTTATATVSATATSVAVAVMEVGPRLTYAMSNGNPDGMKTKLKIDAAGRIVLPQPVRRHFHLQSGSIVNLGIEGDAIVLRPQAYEATLVEEDGLLVHEGEPSGDLLTSLETARRRRDGEVSGGMG